jgi:hypothetical protein
MLEIIRAYRQERLTEAADRGGEQDERRRSHARYFTQLAETSGYYLLGSQQLEWLRSMKVEGAELAAAVPDPHDPYSG